MDQNGEEIRKSKEVVIRQIRAFVEQTVGKLEKEKREKLRQVEGNREKLNQEIGKIENAIFQIDAVFIRRTHFCSKNLGIW